MEPNTIDMQVRCGCCPRCNKPSCRVSSVFFFFSVLYERGRQRGTGRDGTEEVPKRFFYVESRELRRSSFCSPVVVVGCQTTSAFLSWPSSVFVKSSFFFCFD